MKLLNVKCNESVFLLPWNPMKQNAIYWFIEFKKMHGKFMFKQNTICCNGTTINTQQHKWMRLTLFSGQFYQSSCGLVPMNCSNEMSYWMLCTSQNVPMKFSNECYTLHKLKCKNYPPINKINWI